MHPTIEDLVSATPAERERMRRPHRGTFQPLYNTTRVERRLTDRRTPTHRGEPTNG